MTNEFWRQNTIQIFHSNQRFDGSRWRIDKKKTCAWAWTRIRLIKNSSLVRHWQLLFVPYAQTINQNKIFQKLAHKSGEGTKWHLKIQSNLKMTPINPKSAQKRYSKKWYFPVHQNMKVTHFLPGKTCKSFCYINLYDLHEALQPRAYQQDQICTVHYVKTWKFWFSFRGIKKVVRYYHFFSDRYRK